MDKNKKNDKKLLASPKADKATPSNSTTSTPTTDICQLVIVGDLEVGKTSFLLQYSEKKFYENTIMTTGLDYCIRTEIIDNIPVQLKIWDTAGQERYHAQTKSFLKNADAVMLIYDVTSKETYLNLKNWINSINTNPSQSNIKKIIIGNKIDLENKREVNKHEAEKFAKAHNISYFESSAKANINVLEPVLFLAKNVINSEEYKERKIKRENVIKLGEMGTVKVPKQSGGGCC